MNFKNMNAENTQAQMRKGILEYCILNIIQQKDAYASDILEVLQQNKLLVVEGTLYPLLTRLKNANILQYRWEESQSGPPRKYYSLTEKGIDFKTALDKTWHELQEAINQITKN